MFTKNGSDLFIYDTILLRYHLCPMLMYWSLHIVRNGLSYWDWAAAFRLRGAVCIDCHLFQSFRHLLLKYEMRNLHIFNNNNKLWVHNFSCCWKCPQHQPCCQSIWNLQLCASLRFRFLVHSPRVKYQGNPFIKCLNWFLSDNDYFVEN